MRDGEPGLAGGGLSDEALSAAIGAILQALLEDLPPDTGAETEDGGTRATWFDLSQAPSCASFMPDTIAVALATQEDAVLGSVAGRSIRKVASMPTTVAVGG